MNRARTAKSRKRIDRTSIIIGVVIIIVLLIAIIAIIVIAIRWSGILDPPPPSPQDMVLQPEVWGLREKVGPCIGYRLPPLNSTTPSNSVNYSIDTTGLTPIPGGFSPCLWQDEINRQDEQATCLSDVCTDQYGIRHARGDTIIYPSQCEVYGRCTGSVGVLPFSNGLVIHDSEVGYYCISSLSLGEIGLAYCNLFDYNQYFIKEPRFQNNEYVFRLRQREADFILSASDDTVILEPISEVDDGGFHWIIMPAMYTQRGTNTYYSPAQIGYIGDIPDSIINDPTNFNSPDAVRSFMLKYGVRTINRDLRLGPWVYEIPENLTEEGAGTRYNDQAATFTPINRMSDIPYQLS